MKVLTIEQMNKLKELGIDVSNASVRVGQMVFYHGDSLFEFLVSKAIVDSWRHSFALLCSHDADSCSGFRSGKFDF